MSLPLRRYLVTWSRRFSDGQEHEIRDFILARDRKAAGRVVTRLYGSWNGLQIEHVECARRPGPARGK